MDSWIRSWIRGFEVGFMDLKLIPIDCVRDSKHDGPFGQPSQKPWPSLHAWFDSTVGDSLILPEK